MIRNVNAPTGKTLSYEVPILKLRDYDCDMILEKELYFLIPFYLFNFEDDFAKIEAGDMTVIDSFRTRFSELYDRLKERLEKGQIDVMTHHSIIMLTKKVVAALAQSKAAVKEEAEKIMGGQVIDYETKIIYRQGIEQGIEQVITDILLRGKSPEEVSDLCGYPLEQVQTVANKLNIK